MSHYPLSSLLNWIVCYTESGTSESAVLKLLNKHHLESEIQRFVDEKTEGGRRSSKKENQELSKRNNQTQNGRKSDRAYILVSSDQSTFIHKARLVQEYKMSSQQIFPTDFEIPTCNCSVLHSIQAQGNMKSLKAKFKKNEVSGISCGDC
ncbi:hypothetical protein ATANTOWER_003480 [Ataeniobius toweri]|uniref:Uncharacterized protein n=1 Tax=Ataeniobius toweri TaxID=208326 RepID=A0ABU7A1D7_9TELE|nr:hypothetical protein [Ataeniobius toweri]